MRLGSLGFRGWWWDHIMDRGEHNSGDAGQDHLLPIPLLKTKMTIPDLTPLYVERSAIQQRLETGIMRPMILVQAPAGYGKTREIVRLLKHKRIPAAWVSLESTESAPLLFWSYIAAALEPFIPGNVAASFLRKIFQEPLPPFEILLTPLLNALERVSRDVVLVLDDYHTLPYDQMAIHDTLTFFAEHLPRQCHLIIASRWEPPLPIARWRSDERMHIIRAEHMAFTIEHARDLMTRMNLKLTPAHLHRLDTAIECWAMGWQLAFMDVEEKQDVEMAISAFDAAPRLVVDYLSTVVLDNLPDAVLGEREEESLSFLESIAFLDRFNADLCVAVTQRSQSARLLDRLGRAQLFMAPLDKERTWFYFHHLFRSTLSERTRLDAHARSLIFQRASHWCLAHQYQIEAVKYALRSGDLDVMITVIEQCVEHQILLKRVEMVRGWLDVFPDAILQQHPLLALAQAFVELCDNAFPNANTYLDMAESVGQAQAVAPSSLLGEIATLRAIMWFWSKDYVSCQRELNLAKTRFEPAHPFCAIVNLYEGMVQRRLGNFIEAKQYFHDITSTIDREAYPAIYYLALAYLASVHWNLGDSEEAERIYQRFDSSEDLQFDVHVDDRLASAHHLNRGYHYYARDDLTRAGEHFQQAIEESLSSVTKAGGRLGLASVLIAQGRPIEAQQITARAIAPEQSLDQELWRLLRTSQHLFWIQTERMDASDIRLRSLEHDLQRAINLAISPYQRVFNTLTLAKLYMMVERWEDTLQVLSGARTAATTGNWRLILMLALILEAQIQDRLGEETAAMGSLEAAIRLRLWDDYIRLYWDYGTYLPDLLRRWRARLALDDDVQPFIDRLLRGFEPRPSVAAPPASQSVAIMVDYPLDMNPDTELTSREVDVLRYVVKGTKNDEIAQVLGIKHGTVKRHITHIYEKLGVVNRVQAIAQSYARGILKKDKGKDEDKHKDKEQHPPTPPPSDS